MLTFLLTLASLFVINSTQPNGNSFTCPEDDCAISQCLYPNLDDCSKFWQCSNGEPHVQQCPDGLEFNDFIKVCDWPSDDTCRPGLQPTPGPTSAPIEGTTETTTEGTTVTVEDTTPLTVTEPTVEDTTETGTTQVTDPGQTESTEEQTEESVNSSSTTRRPPKPSTTRRPRPPRPSTTRRTRPSTTRKPRPTRPSRRPRPTRRTTSGRHDNHFRPDSLIDEIFPDIEIM